ncbi:hypothetical protein ACVWZK_001338 [Bradyrhizobium sp. GM0.4]
MRTEPVVERADQGIGLDGQLRLGQLLGKAPQLAAAGDRRMIVEEHLVDEAAGLAAERHRDDLAAFRVVSEAGGIRHANEFVIHHRLGQLQRLRHDPAQRLRVGPVLDDEIFAVDEAIRAGRESRIRQRHREGDVADLLVHAVGS